MRTAFLMFVTFAPMAACSNGFVTAPPAVVPALPVAAVVSMATGPATVPLRGITVGGAVVLRSDINPADIEQIEVIKGPAAATLYAPISRGCPVIRIRTRRPGPAPRRGR